MSETTEKYTANVARYSFPYINTQQEYRDITVERRGRLGDDCWAIVHMQQCYQPKGRRWTYERSNSSRTDKFLKASRMPLEQALPLAERLAKNLSMEWGRRIANMIARQEAVKAIEKALEKAEGDS